MIVILDNVRSALNVGSIFRTCDAFGVDELLLCGISATPPSREVHKTALGAELSVAWRYFEKTVDAVAELKKSGIEVVAVEQSEQSVELTNFEPNDKAAYVMGNEVDGVSAEVIGMCDRVVEIAQVGIKKSLNVSVAAGIVLWSVKR